MLHFTELRSFHFFDHLLMNIHECGNGLHESGLVLQDDKAVALFYPGLIMVLLSNTYPFRQMFIANNHKQSGKCKE
jgi:hypothetical protein